MPNRGMRDVLQSSWLNQERIHSPFLMFVPWVRFLEVGRVDNFSARPRIFIAHLESFTRVPIVGVDLKFVLLFPDEFVIMNVSIC